MDELITKEELKEKYSYCRYRAKHQLITKEELKEKYSSDVKQVYDIDFHIFKQLNRETRRQKRFDSLFYLRLVICMLSITILLYFMFLDFMAIKTNKETMSFSVFDKLNVISEYIQDGYYGDTTNVNFDDGICKGYVAALGDPYSGYFPAEEYKDAESSVTGQYMGIGVVVTKNKVSKYLKVLYVYPNSPAEADGVLIDDEIKSIDGKDIYDMNQDDSVALMHKEKGAEVDLVVIRNRASIEIKTHCDEVATQSIWEKDLDDDIGYMSIVAFKQETPKEFEQIMDSFIAKNKKGVVIDLRDNPGGLMDSAIEIIDTLSDKDRAIYVTDKNGQNKDIKLHKRKKYNIPIAILINGNSASASEIMAGSLREVGDNVTLFGTTTYGKGVAQAMVRLPDGAGLRLTVEEFFLPSGQAINKVGVKPDIEVQEGYSVSLDRVAEIEIIKATAEEMLYDNQVRAAYNFLKDVVENQ